MKKIPKENWEVLTRKLYDILKYDYAHLDQGFVNRYSEEVRGQAIVNVLDVVGNNLDEALKADTINITGSLLKSLKDRGEKGVDKDVALWKRAADNKTAPLPGATELVERKKEWDRFAAERKNYEEGRENRKVFESRVRKKEFKDDFPLVNDLLGKMTKARITSGLSTVYDGMDAYGLLTKDEETVNGLISMLAEKYRENKSLKRIRIGAIGYKLGTQWLGIISNILDLVRNGDRGSIWNMPFEDRKKGLMDSVYGFTHGTEKTLEYTPFWTSTLYLAVRTAVKSEAERLAKSGAYS